MKTIYLFVAVILTPCWMNAQYADKIWCFGDSAGIDFNNLNNPIPISTVLDTRGSCVSISNSNGQILFYAQTRATLGSYTTQVFNHDNQLMINGDSIWGEGWYNELIIIPNSGDSNQYYLFSLSVATYYGLFYSVIDMSLDSGKGAVVIKNVEVNHIKAVDCLSAVKHGNGRDWWLVFKSWVTANNEFSLYLITPSGIVMHHDQSIGDINSTNNANFSFSKDGTLALFTSYTGLIEVMKFDRCTGYFDSVMVIEPETIANPLKRCWGSAISSDKSKIYVSNSDTVSYLFQYDLNAADIPASKHTIFIFNNVEYEGGALRLAPDDKIYISNAWNDGINFNYPYPDSAVAYNFINMNLGVVNYPDSLGAGCDFQPYSFYLGGKRAYWGLPNNPNYDLSVETGSICDTISVYIPHITRNNELKIFYHPGWQIAFVNATGLWGDKYSLALVDLTGRTVISKMGVLESQSFTTELNCSGLANGIYIVTINIKDQKLVKIFMKE
jgi:hypothetical protein